MSEDNLVLSVLYQGCDEWTRVWNVTENMVKDDPFITSYQLEDGTIKENPC